MSVSERILAGLALLALAAAPAPAAGGATLRWKGQRHELERLPVTLPADARRALERWGPYAEAGERRLDLSDDGRVLLVHPDSGADRRRELAWRVLARCDALLPPPAERRSIEPAAPDGAPAAPEGGPAELPEDPEGGPAGAGLLQPAERTSSTWGYQPGEPERGTAVLFVPRDVPEYERLLARLGELHEPLRPWAALAREQVGFVLEWPLAAAYLLDAPGMEEWNPDNELVNRLAQLLVLRRFGRQPTWVVQGFAWRLEMELLGAIYCFPYRAEFVWATEHTGWERELATRFRRKGSRLEPAKLTGWTRGKYEDERAKLAFGAMGFLFAEHPAELPAFLETLRVTSERESRVDDGAGGWTRDTEHQLSPARTEELLTAAFGADVLTRAADWLRGGGR